MMGIWLKEDMERILAGHRYVVDRHQWRGRW